MLGWVGFRANEPFARKQVAYRGFTRLGVFTDQTQFLIMCRSDLHLSNIVRCSMYLYVSLPWG